MSCTESPTPYLPEDDYWWSEDLCHRARFVHMINPDNGEVEIITDHRVRALGDLSHQDTSPYQPCKYHLGRLSLNDRGEVSPWMCGANMNDREFVSPMKSGVIGATPEDPDNIRQGETAFVAYFRGPQWTEVRYYSQDRFCTPPIG